LALNLKQGEVIKKHSIVRILVVEDFAGWRQYILEKLKQNHDLQVIGVACDGHKGVLKAEELQPDLILLDIGLPKLDGIGAARQIRKLAPDAKILFVSQELDATIALAALSAGGHGYVVKLDAGEELFQAMEAVLAGRKYVSPRLADYPV
jgi:DNA-binding NarL/FixJ family response regulator